MKLLIKNIQGLKLPTQANEGEDAAYDIVATSEPEIVGTKISRPIDGLDMWNKISFIQYRTNLFIAPQSATVEEVKSNIFGDVAKIITQTINYHTEAFPRSSVSKMNLVLANSVGLIDTGYRNEVLIRFKYIFQPEDFIIIDEAGGRRCYGTVNRDAIYQLGEKIAQIKVLPNIPIEVELVESLPPSKRGEGGFGSSGK